MKIEVRDLTVREFKDLVDNASDGGYFIKYLLDIAEDPYYVFYFSSFKSMGILVDNIPVYAGCLLEEQDGYFTYTLVRKNTRYKFPFTLYKICKKVALEWAKEVGTIKCRMQLDKGEESNLINKWIIKMGYKAEKVYPAFTIMSLK